MYAIIINEKKEYYTPVLALINKELSTKLIVLDSTYSKVIIKDYWTKSLLGKTTRTAFIINANKDSWVKKENIEGIPEIIHNKYAIRYIKQGKCPSEIETLAKNLQKSLIIKEWLPLNNEENIDSFNELTFGLHDSYIKEIKKEDRITYLYIDTTWQCEIIMRCYNVIESNLEIDCIFYDSNFNFENNKVIFLPEEISYSLDKDINLPKLVCSRIEYKLSSIKIE